MDDTGAAVFPEGSEGFGVLIGGSVGRFGANDPLGLAVGSPETIGGLVSLTGSGVMFAVVGIGVGRAPSTGLGVSNCSFRAIVKSC